MAEFYNLAMTTFEKTVPFLCGSLCRAVCPVGPDLGQTAE